MVVLPVPGGPQSTTDDSRSASISTRSGRPGPSRCCWPNTSSSERGRRRAASGARRSRRSVTAALKRSSATARCYGRPWLSDASRWLPFLTDREGSPMKVMTRGSGARRGSRRARGLRWWRFRLRGLALGVVGHDDDHQHGGDDRTDHAGTVGRERGIRRVGWRVRSQQPRSHHQGVGWSDHAPRPRRRSRPTDTDSDGLTDAEESQLGTDPNNADSDSDGIPDGREVNALGSNPLDTDTDSDGLTDALEVDHSCDVNAPDTDGEGLGDAFEANSGFSECSLADTDGDGDDDWRSSRSGPTRGTRTASPDPGRSVSARSTRPVRRCGRPLGDDHRQRGVSTQSGQRGSERSRSLPSGPRSATDCDACRAAERGFSSTACQPSGRPGVFFPWQ